MAEGAGRKIVVIEDDEHIRTLVVAFLASAGYAVVSSSDPAGAVALVRREDPDLILCDIAMPGLDGYGVLKALQADPETARYPVVFLTAHREFTERVQAFRFGVVDYLRSPSPARCCCGGSSACSRVWTGARASQPERGAALPAGSWRRSTARRARVS